VVDCHSGAAGDRGRGPWNGAQPPMRKIGAQNSEGFYPSVVMWRKVSTSHQAGATGRMRERQVEKSECRRNLCRGCRSRSQRDVEGESAHRATPGASTPCPAAWNTGRRLVLIGRRGPGSGNSHQLPQRYLPTCLLLEGFTKLWLMAGRAVEAAKADEPLGNFPWGTHRAWPLESSTTGSSLSPPGERVGGRTQLDRPWCIRCTGG